MNSIVRLNSAKAVFPALTSTTDFDAVAEPIYMVNHTENRATKIDQSIGRVIRRTDNWDALGIVGAKYGIAPNKPLYDMVCEASEDTLPSGSMRGIELKEFSSNGGAYTRFELVFPALAQPIEQYRGQTELNFRIGISNSFNGSGSVRVFAGAYDLVCTNGLIVGEVEKRASRHTSGYTPNKFADFIRHELTTYQERARIWQQYARKFITPEQAKETLEQAGMSERRIKHMLDQFEIESADRGRTVWALYSALTFYSSHNSNRFGVRNSGNVDNVAITLDNREREVSKIISSKPWAELAKVA
jgi:hypothetical protein